MTTVCPCCDDALGWHDTPMEVLEVTCESITLVCPRCGHTETRERHLADYGKPLVTDRV